MEKKKSVITPDSNVITSFLNSHIPSEVKKSSEKPKFNRTKSSFFGTANPRRSSGFFSTSTKNKNIWLDDRPAPDTLGEYYELRKKIIFSHINLSQNESEFGKLILNSQTKTNNTIKQGGLFFIPRDVYEWTLTLKENIANYCLLLISYLNAKKNITAHHLFLLMDIQNREKVEKIFEQIKKNFKNMSNSNRIGKFYPSIIRNFMQILGVLIKLSNKFNKLSLENYYLKRYLMTINIVKETVINRFISFNYGVENDFKNLGRYFFYDCLFKLAIYSFEKYQFLNEIFCSS